MPSNTSAAPVPRSTGGIARLLGCLFLSLVAAAPVHSEHPNTRYQQLCASCHGSELAGGKGGSLLGPLKHGDDPDALTRIITDGLPRTGMPAFGGQLSAANVHALVVFLREKRAAPPPPPQVRPPDPAEVRYSELHKFRVEYVVREGLQVPWSFTWLPDGRIVLTERAGRLRLIENGRLDPEPFEGLPRVVEKGEGGLMAVAVHAGWVYLSFSDPGPAERAMTKVVRGRLRGKRFTDQETIFAIPSEQYPEGFVLFGSRLEFDGEHLFFTVGERAVVGDAQKLDRPGGKLHRVFADGRIPPDNPFVGHPGACESIWSYGHRNPQGLAIHPGTREVWCTEHGPRGGDELNLIRRGANYGWPVVTHGINCDGSPVTDRTAADGMEPPVRHWTPSIAIAPLAFYTGDRFPRWKDHLFAGSLAQQQLIRFEVHGGRVVHEEEIFRHLGRVRDIKTGPDGFLYVALEQLGGASGWLVRLIPADPP